LPHIVERLAAHSADSKVAASIDDMPSRARTSPFDGLLAARKIELIRTESERACDFFRREVMIGPLRRLVGQHAVQLHGGLGMTDTSYRSDISSND